MTLCVCPPHNTHVFNVIANLRPFPVVLPLPPIVLGYRYVHHRVFICGSEGFFLHFQLFGLRLSQVNESVFHPSRLLRGLCPVSFIKERGFLSVFIYGAYLIVVYSFWHLLMYKTLRSSRHGSGLQSAVLRKLRGRIGGSRTSWGPCDEISAQRISKS